MIVLGDVLLTLDRRAPRGRREHGRTQTPFRGLLVQGMGVLYRLSADHSAQCSPLVSVEGDTAAGTTEHVRAREAGIRPLRNASCLLMDGILRG